MIKVILQQEESKLGREKNGFHREMVDILVKHINQSKLI